MKHYLLIYTGASDYLERRPLYRDEHLRLTWEAVQRGELLLGGTTGVVSGETVDGAMVLWGVDEAPKVVEEFASADPYVMNGLVTKWEIKKWDTVVGYNSANPMKSAGAPRFAVPQLPSNDLHATLKFFKGLGAEMALLVADDTYGIVHLGGAVLQFYPSDDKHIAEWSSCRIVVGDIKPLYDFALLLGVVHPNGKLEKKPWGSTEFSVLDPTGVCYAFAQSRT